VNVGQGDVLVTHTDNGFEEGTIRLRAVDFLDFLDLQLGQIRQMWASYSVLDAHVHALDVDRIIVSSLPASSGWVRDELFRRRASLAVERTQINTRRYPRSQIRALSAPLIKLVRDIADEIQDDTVAVSAAVADAHLSYNVGDNVRARRLMLETIPKLSSPNAILGAHRTLAIVAGRLGDDRTVRRSSQAIRSTVKSGSFTELSHALNAMEGIARAEYYLGKPTSHDALAPVKEVARSLESVFGLVPADCRILLGRTECDIIAAHYPGEGEHLRKLAESTLNLAQSSGHAKYISQLDRFLSTEAGRVN
jgi:hypothetical protein